MCVYSEHSNMAPLSAGAAIASFFLGWRGLVSLVVILIAAGVTTSLFALSTAVLLTSTASAVISFLLTLTVVREL